MNIQITHTFNYYEDQEAFQTIINASNYRRALWDVGQLVFRPARKHGYDDANINELLEKIGDDGYELIALLETRFYQILEKNDAGSATE